MHTEKLFVFLFILLFENEQLMASHKSSEKVGNSTQFGVGFEESFVRMLRAYLKFEYCWLIEVFFLHQMQRCIHVEI